jgi:small subunit ribosomal protein S7
MLKKNLPSFIPENSSPEIEKLVTRVLLHGKKNIARAIVNQALEIVKNRGYADPLQTFQRAMSNVTPLLEVRAKRIGGSVYQVPVEVSPKRQVSLSYRWILDAARSKKGSPLAKRLADEIIEAAEGMGAAVKKKEDVFKMAQANKAFAHFARY